MTTDPPDRPLEEPVSDEPTPTEPQPAVEEPTSPVLVDEPITESQPVEPIAQPGTPWPAAGGYGTPPPTVPPPVVPSPAPAMAPARPAPWKQFIAGALVGALVGGATAGGIFLATKDDSTTSRTVIVRSGAASGRNTSVIAEPKDIQGILAKIEPAVVAIRTGDAVDATLFPNGSDSGSGAAGTGFVVSSDGVVVTNNHVIANAGGRIQVAFSDGSIKKARVLGRSPENDLAVLKVDATGLPTAKLGNSDALAVGDQVVAIGNALALEGGLSVTRGIISAKGRTVQEESGNTIIDALQTDAAINPGNSGGPLVNSNGEVVGINTALAGGSQNVGFAISINGAKRIVDELSQGKAVKTAFLGVQTTEVTPEIVNQLNLGTKSGVVVVKVTAGSGAAAAGLKADDVIVQVAGKKVTTPEGVAAEIRRHQPGDKLNVTIERGGKRQTISVTLGVRPSR